MTLRKLTALYLTAWLVFPVGWAQQATQPATDLQQISERSYLEILEQAGQVKVSNSQLDAMKQQFEREKKRQQDELKEQIKLLETQQKSLQKQLDALNKQASRDTPEMAEQRREIHCSVLAIEKQIHDAKIKRETTLQVEYENKLAKLELAQRWPSEQKEILQQLQSGTARQRSFGNVEDIGVRTIREGQADDVKRGQEAIRELKQYGMIPPEMDDPEVKDYINRLGQKLSENSDLKVPLQLTVLNSEEINAFALPGGFLYINSGLILKAENESELAGVMAHEMAHVTARHSARLSKKANIASILFQGAQLAALILTGGTVSSLLAAYLFQYGFYGLGLAISLTLLGVSRDYEMEADQLGVQYAWKSGYDPKGFITFFDKMASEKGYVRSTSFFRTHPAFAERIIHSFREISFLPPLEEYIYDTPEFHKAQESLKRALEEARKTKPANAPSLKRKRIDIECDPDALRQPPELTPKPKLSRPQP
ncbi:MAG: M48 family metalloprotease [Acidobacteria bacterium]|nr:M48 family metalloprotease [Acidobacteriota bacterium]